MLGQYLDYQRATMLAKADGLTREQLARPHPPSSLTLAGLLYHLALVEETWMEVRFAGWPVREPWAGVDWDAARSRRAGQDVSRRSPASGQADADCCRTSRNMPPGDPCHPR